MYLRKFIIILLLPAFTCCRKPYNPPAVATSNSYLVVEGTINSGADSTVIKLSRTVKLNAQTTVNPVTNATVLVENDQQAKWPLISDGTGQYIASGLNLPTGPNYRLHITTTDGRQYISDYQPVKSTPSIDSLGYTVTGNVINLYVNAHDPVNNTHYYMWKYNEAWLFHARYQSEFIADSLTNSIVPRTPSQDVYTCYGGDASSHILLTSTAKLSQDVVFQSPLISIPINSEKLEKQYEIYVRQYALTADAYNFYQNLKNNTENLGSIFDAEPAELQGNIHNTTNPSEPVIGWISIATVQSGMLIITNSQVVPLGTPVNYPADCPLENSLFKDVDPLQNVQNVLIDPPHTDLPVTALYSGPDLIGYSYSSAICTDCTILGKKQAPWFWK